MIGRSFLCDVHVQCSLGPQAISLTDWMEGPPSISAFASLLEEERTLNVCLQTPDRSGL